MQIHSFGGYARLANYTIDEQQYLALTTADTTAAKSLNLRVGIPLLPNKSPASPATSSDGRRKSGAGGTADMAHNNNHMEVFKSNGDVRVVLNLDGTVNLSKTQAAINEGRKLKLK
jgi:hypothetical protein